MKIKSVTNKKPSNDAVVGQSKSVLDGINSQIKVLRSLMMRFDDKNTRTAANRVNEMRATIMLGSVYPIHSLESASAFFCSR